VTVALTEHDIRNAASLSKRYITTQRNDPVNSMVHQVAQTCKEQIDKHLGLQCDSEIGSGREERMASHEGTMLYEVPAFWSRLEIHEVDIPTG
jgi:hypothetical protein